MISAVSELPLLARALSLAERSRCSIRVSTSRVRFSAASARASASSDRLRSDWHSRSASSARVVASRRTLAWSAFASPRSHSRSCNARNASRSRIFSATPTFASSDSSLLTSSSSRNASALAPAHSSSFSCAAFCADLRDRSEAASCNRVAASSATSSSAFSLTAASSSLSGASSFFAVFAKHLAASALLLCASHSSFADASRLRRPSASAVS